MRIVYNKLNSDFVKKYRVFIKYCVFSLKCCDFSELCQFFSSAGFLPRGNKVRNILKNLEKNTIFNEHPVLPTNEKDKIKGEKAVKQDNKI